MNEGDHVAKLFEGPVRAKVEKIMAEHLDSPVDSPQYLANVLLKRAFLEKWPVYDQSKDLEILDRLANAVYEIEKLYYFGLTRVITHPLLRGLLISESMREWIEIPLNG